MSCPICCAEITENNRCPSDEHYFRISGYSCELVIFHSSLRYHLVQTIPSIGLSEISISAYTHHAEEKLYHKLAYYKSPDELMALLTRIISMRAFL